MYEDSSVYLINMQTINTLLSEGGLLYKEVTFYRKMTSHFAQFIRHGVVNNIFNEFTPFELKEALLEEVLTKFEGLELFKNRFFEKFEDLEFLKEVGFDEEYLAERKELIQGYNSVLEAVDFSTRLVLNMTLKDEVFNLLDSAISKMQKEFPYYYQLEKIFECIEGVVKMLKSKESDVEDSLSLKG